MNAQFVRPNPPAEPFDFKRFENDDYLLVRNPAGLRFSLSFERIVTVRSQDDDDDEHAEEDPNEDKEMYSITAYCKMYPTDRNCTCDEGDEGDDDDDDDDEDCRCNWNFELTGGGSSRSKRPEECIDELLGRISKVISCKRCQRTHEQYGHFETCGACYLQDRLDRDLPVVDTCPVCLDGYKETSAHRFRACRHAVCLQCYPKLQGRPPKVCPLCRTREY